jgi:hypothetical protein
MYWKEQLKPIISTLLVFSAIVAVVSSLVIGNPAFDNEQKEITLDSPNNWLEDRQERNLASMNMHYAQFMSLGQANLSQKYIDVALRHFFNAKTLFPERIEPRKNLCYSYVVKCQSDSRWCRQAKREIYYALKYVNDADPLNKQYIEQLADIVKLDTVATMTENDALAALYVN